jgi:hypothetical protein
MNTPWVRDFFSMRPGDALLTFEEFRQRYGFPHYSPPFARKFMNGKKPIDPDRQRKSYETAARVQEEKACAAYANYLEMAKVAGIS